MNKTEQSYDDLLGDYDPSATSSAEAITRRPVSMIDQVVETVELPSQLKHIEFPTTESVIAKINEYTEHNQTIERILERRHEVKDFAASDNQKMQYTAKLSEFFDTSPKIIRLQPQDINSEQQHRKKASPVHHLLHDTSLQGYAIRYGLFSTTLALLTAIFAVILFT